MAKRVVIVTLADAEGEVVLRFPVGPNGGPMVPHFVSYIMQAEPPPRVIIEVEDSDG